MATHPNGEVFYLCELRGLSTDEKPTVIENGTIENGSATLTKRIVKVVLDGTTTTGRNGQTAHLINIIQQ